MGLGSPLQRIAMGLVIVVGYAGFPAHPTPAWQQYDGLPNPLGWILVVSGCLPLARQRPVFTPVLWLAALSGVVSVPMWWPQVPHALDASGQWCASLPQLAFCLWLARTIGQEGARQQPRDAYAAHRGGLLVWGFGILVALPVVVFGAGVGSLAAATDLASLLVNVVFVYVLFRLHRRTWLAGPGPLEVHPARRTS